MSLNLERTSSSPVPSGSDPSVDLDTRERWAIILAGGDGSRLLPFTRKIVGDDRPKQFCPVINGYTLLDQTRHRVALSISPTQTMFVLTQKHECYYAKSLSDTPRARLVEQPRNAGTAAAILYSLMRLECINPSAIAAFFPSDHYFSDDHAFMSQVDAAFDAARRHSRSIVLLGIEPEGPDEEYGWIEPGPAAASNYASDLWRVRRFWEKPSAGLARNLMDRGCLWNSFVMVGSVSAFLTSISQAIPHVYAAFDAVRSELTGPNEAGLMNTVYSDLRDTNFSREVLQARPEDLSVIPVRGSKWSDLGNPRRVFSTLSNISGSALVKHQPASLLRLPKGYYERKRVSSSPAV